MKNDTKYDVVIVGGGHNGLIASCYLAMAGLRVLILEKNDHLGGATWSNYTFSGVNVRVSEYSYLISLLPQKILSDLGINFEIRQRPVASFTPHLKEGTINSILISNTFEDTTRNSFIKFTGDDREYQNYRILQEKLAIFARNVWPTLLSPLPSKKELRD
ncbi:MAG TPA: FAD-dependent oxidoreductase, partial [Anaerolineaceae bacterium]|nr:FAD-dependent oxidoreductase [Anaerolineaceae bacterium]